MWDQNITVRTASAEPPIPSCGPAMGRIPVNRTIFATIETEPMTKTKKIAKWSRRERFICIPRTIGMIMTVGNSRQIPTHGIKKKKNKKQKDRLPKMSVDMLRPDCRPKTHM